VDKIVKSVLNLAVLSATNFPVGLQSRMEEVIQIIKNESRKVCRIAICGMKGSGKTTLAKAIYNQIHDIFTEKFFIEDIAQVTQTRGRVPSETQFLSNFLKTFGVGRSMIRERLLGKSVLIVLDDIIEYGPLFDQWVLNLLSYSGAFGRRSVIIITTSDEDLAKRPAYSTFQINIMNPNESLELLSWHAFREAKPKEECHFLAKMVVDYCGGLPLALEVIGSCLYERPKEEWNKVLSRLESIPRHEVLQILKISFDGLLNQSEKDLFLDVCCFFVGKDITYVTKILNICGVDPDRGIRVLIERSLIKVEKNNKVGMHPLLQEMGTKIVRDFSRKRNLRGTIIFWLMKISNMRCQRNIKNIEPKILIQVN